MRYSSSPITAKVLDEITMRVREREREREVLHKMGYLSCWWVDMILKSIEEEGVEALMRRELG